MRYAASIALTAFVVAGCEGDAGPAGPAGIVNVSSGTFTVAPGVYQNDFWRFPVDGGTQANPAKVATVAVPAITSEIVNSGAVFVYLKTPTTAVGAADQWTLLPFHQGGFGGGFLVSIKAAVRAGEIRIGYSHESTGATAPPNVYNMTLPTYEFRWVAIQGTTAALGAIAVNSPDRLIEQLRRGGVD